jgi:2-dehydro-3-deoxyphosphogluconate aldolase/(4S)-4-hydroxy-2-oxoglutarate aldolase
MPTGGVEPNEENLSAWFNAGAYCVGMGSKLITKEIINTGNYKQLTEKVKVTLSLVKAINEKK